MCGIVGGAAERNVLPILLEGLRRLEYRGYDSAGVALCDGEHIQRRRVVGKVAGLEAALKQHPLAGHMGIAHTRWATHGKPTEANAHPHMSGDRLAVVHNGIIENYSELRLELEKKGVAFTSQTDTEVIVHLIAQALKTKNTLLTAVQHTVKRLTGAYAIAVISADFPSQLIAVRSGSPLVIGVGIGEHFIASDSVSLLPVTRRFIYLAEGDVVEMTREHFQIYDSHGTLVTRFIDEISGEMDAANKAGYKHYMLKEIYEQPSAIARTMTSTFGPEAETLFKKLQHIRIVACGTSYHAAMVAKYWFEEHARVSCEVDIASELRYRHAVTPPHSLWISISQSGETADTLAALRQAKTQGYLASLAICNVSTSSLVRESDFTFLTQAGTEMGVASTKAFTTQLTALLILCGTLAKVRQSSPLFCQLLAEQLPQLPRLLTETLQLNNDIAAMAEYFIEKRHALFLGRGVHYPMALEGALKLKEISYIHAEAYPAGELKHGPLALVDNEMPVVAIAPEDELLDKLKSNLQVVKARGGELLVITERRLCDQLGVTGRFIGLPSIPTLIAPIVYAIPLQLLAYHVAVLKGTDVDQPRNLAKSVTVE